MINFDITTTMKEPDKLRIFSEDGEEESSHNYAGECLYERIVYQTELDFLFSIFICYAVPREYKCVHVFH
jgi:hypothetical protein